MRKRWVLVSFGAVVVALTGCGADPDRVAQSDSASLDELFKRDSSGAEMRTLLTQRGYICADSEDAVDIPDGSKLPATHHVECTKTLRDTLLCKDRVRVALMPTRSSSTSVSFGRERKCL